MNIAGNLVDNSDSLVTSETRDRARRTVARYATDLDDCADLLAMLGLTATTPVVAAPVVVKEPQKRTPPASCACGAPVWRQDGSCYRCRFPVPAADVRALALEVSELTGMDLGQIGERLGRNPNGFRSQLAPGRVEGRFMTTAIYEGLRALRDELEPR